MSKGYEQPKWPQRELGWNELEARLHELRGSVEQLLREEPEATEVYTKFAGLAGAIIERTPPDLVDSVQSELGAILRDLKLTGDSVD